MSIDESTAKGLTKRFQREVAEGVRRYSSKLSVLPVNCRPKAQREMVNQLLRAAGPAGAFGEASKRALQWGVWHYAENSRFGDGYSLTRWWWPIGGDVSQVARGYPLFISSHFVGRVAQAHLDDTADVGTLGGCVGSAVLPLYIMAAAEDERELTGMLVNAHLGQNTWVVNDRGCILLGFGTGGARIAKTYIAKADWDLWRDEKWGRYLDTKDTILIADSSSGDVLGVIGGRTGFSDGAKAASEVAKFNLAQRGIQSRVFTNDTP